MIGKGYRDEVVLTGMTQHGKDKIREHGIVWLILRHRDKTTDHKEGYLLCSVETGYQRWVEKNNDKHFSVI